MLTLHGDNVVALRNIVFYEDLVSDFYKTTGTGVMYANLHTLKEFLKKKGLLNEK